MKKDNAFNVIQIIFYQSQIIHVFKFVKVLKEVFNQFCFLLNFKIKINIFK